MKIRAGTGFSIANDAVEAGKEAASAAIASLGGESPALFIVFTSPRYDLPVLLTAIRSITGDSLLIGSTSSGEIVQGLHLDIGAGVGVLALTAGDYRFGVASITCTGNDLDQAGQIVARECKNMAGPSPHAAVLLLADAMLGKSSRISTGCLSHHGSKSIDRGWCCWR